MISFAIQGNILESDLQTLVCPVNTVGVMGAGLALQFKEAYPGLLPAYKRACWQGEFKKGFWVWPVSKDRKILCIPTKQHWKHPSKLKWIQQSLEQLAAHYQEHGITSIAMPPIGCGHGQLEWDDVEPLILHYLGPIKDLEVGLYLP